MFFQILSVYMHIFRTHGLFMSRDEYKICAIIYILVFEFLHLLEKQIYK